MAIRRPQAEALGDAGAEAFDEDLGPFDQAQHQLAAARLLQIDDEGFLVAVEQIMGPRRLAGAPDADDLRPHIRQQHGAEGPRPQPRQFDDRDARKRSHDLAPVPILRFSLANFGREQDTTLSCRARDA